jgi:hypothetical protein
MLKRPLLVFVCWSCLALLASGQELKSRDGEFSTPQETFPEHVRAKKFVQLATHPTHSDFYHLLGAWNASEQPRPVKVRHSEDLIGLLVDFPGKWAPEKRAIKLDVSSADKGSQALIRSALTFFWQPRLDKDTNVPRLNLVGETATGTLAEYQVVDQIGYSGIIPRSLYSNPAGLNAVRGLLQFWKEIGERGTGRTMLLLEEDQPPECALYVWYPDDDCWRKPQLMSPCLGDRLTAEIVEDFPALKGQLNVGRLPRGTWDRIKAGRAGGQSGQTRPLDLISLGREGLVMGTANKGVGPYYEVHLLREKGKQQEYEPRPRRTRGLSVTPRPSWVKSFNLKGPWDAEGRWTSVEGAQHLVALSVCSPKLWRQERFRAREPETAHLGKLFCDPELWAIPE